jgi:hypothetical protein
MPRTRTHVFCEVRDDEGVATVVALCGAMKKSGLRFKTRQS